jgi:predicted dehydrogenase
VADPTLCVIGAGQLGTRHLQSLATLTGKYEFHAVDSSSQALENARKSLGPVSEALKTHTSIQDLPKNLDVVVVATGAAVRRKVVTELLAHSSVRYLVLEKILFQTVSDCLFMGELLAQHKNMKVWVNLARRLQPAYQAIQATLKPNQPMAIHVSGSRWGLATSALHFLDLVLYLTGSATLSINQFEGQLYPSRHPDCFECTGSLSGKAGVGQTYSITAWAESNAPLRVTVDTPECRWIVYEKGSQVHAIKSIAASEWMPEALAYPMFFQSQLTGPMADTILKTGTCGLSDYATALASHAPFLRAWNQTFAPGSDPDQTPCKIT